MDGMSELAKLFKERENIIYMGPIVGTVLAAPPEIKIEIDKNIILTKDHLVISAHVLNNYKRKVIIDGEKIKFTQTDPPVSIGKTKIASKHLHEIEDINIDTEVRIEAKEEDSYLKTTDTLKKGDKVILIPSIDEQNYFLVDKAVRL